MSLYDYQASKRLHVPFYALIMAAMRDADSHNAALLQVSFAAVWDKLQARYNAPGGMLPDELERAEDDRQRTFDRGVDYATNHQEGGDDAAA